VELLIVSCIREMGKKQFCFNKGGDRGVPNHVQNEINLMAFSK